MTKINERTAANMDVVLDEVCSGLPHGGDHESRKHIAQRLMQSAKPKIDAKCKERQCDPGGIANRGQSRAFRTIQPQIGVMRIGKSVSQLSSPTNRIIRTTASPIIDPAPIFCVPMSFFP
jgi:hypothetical protein